MTSLILVLMSTILAADEAGPALRPEAVETLFVEPDRPATIRWRADRDLPAVPSLTPSGTSRTARWGRAPPNGRIRGRSRSR